MLDDSYVADPTQSASGGYFTFTPSGKQLPVASPRSRVATTNRDGLPNRERYMGGTPGKDSTVGREVQERMRREGTLRGNGDSAEVLGPDNKWYPINQTDMGHIESAVSYWNREGRYYGPQSPEVKRFMNDANNYRLEPSSINRCNGATCGMVYSPPATGTQRLIYFSTGYGSL